MSVVTYVQNWGGNTGAATSVTANFSTFTPTSGNTLIAVIGKDDDVATTLSGDSFTLLGSWESSNNIQLEVWAREATGTETSTTWSADSEAWHYMVTEWSGVDFDNISLEQQATSTGSSIFMNAVTSTKDNSAVLYGCVTDRARAITATSLTELARGVTGTGAGDIGFMDGYVLHATAQTEAAFNIFYAAADESAAFSLLLPAFDPPPAITFSGSGNLKAVYLEIEDGRCFVGGGNVAAGGNSTDVEGFDSADDTIISVSDGLDNARGELGGHNSLYNGYFCGGWEGGNSTKIDRIRFGDESVALATASLDVGRHRNKGFSNVELKGYTCGGRYSGSNTGDDIEALIYDTETVQDISDALDAPSRDYLAMESPTRGYIGGGYDDNIAGKIDDIQYVRFDTDAAGTVTATLSTVRDTGDGVHNLEKGLWCAGYFVTTVEGFTFSTETTYTPSGNLSNSWYNGGYGNTTYHGYLFGGDRGGGAINKIQETSWASETWADNSTSLGATRTKPGCVSSANRLTAGNFVEGVVSYDATADLVPRGRRSPFTSWVGEGSFGAFGRVEYTSAVSFSGEDNDLHPQQGESVFYGYVTSSEYQTLGSRLGSKHSHRIDITYTVEYTAAALSELYSSATGSESSSNGYLGGGYRGNPVATHDNVEKLVFSTGSYSNLGSTLDYTHPNEPASWRSDTVSYWTGGFGTDNGEDISGLTHSTDASKTVSESMVQQRQSACATSGPSKAFIHNGDTVGLGNGDWDAFTYSTETTAAIANTLNNDRGTSSCFSETVGHYNKGDLADMTMFKIVFSTETITDTSLTIRDNTAVYDVMVQNANEGIGTGGINGVNKYSDMWGIDFATETKNNITESCVGSNRNAGISDYRGALPASEYEQELQMAGVGDLTGVGTIENPGAEFGAVTFGGVGSFEAAAVQTIGADVTMSGSGDVTPPHATMIWAGKYNVAAQQPFFSSFRPGDTVVSNAQAVGAATMNTNVAALGYGQITGVGAAIEATDVSGIGWFEVSGDGAATFTDWYVEGAGHVDAVGVGAATFNIDVSGQGGFILEPVLDQVQTVHYLGTLQADGEPDLDVRIKYFNIIRRDDSPSYYTVTAPWYDELTDTLENYRDGTFVIKAAPVYIDGSSPTPYVYDSFDIYDMRTSEGGASRSIVFIGYKTETIGSILEIEVLDEDVTSYSTDSNGLTEFGLSPRYSQLTPASSLSYSGDSYELDYVELNLSPESFKVKAKGVKQ